MNNIRTEIISGPFRHADRSVLIPSMCCTYEYILLRCHTQWGNTDESEAEGTDAIYKNCDLK